jgi:hypothetical protein
MKIKYIILSLLSVAIAPSYAMFDDSCDYYKLLDVPVNAPQNTIQKAFTKKIKPYFLLLGSKENYPGNTLRDRLIAYDKVHGTPYQHKLYDRDKKIFDVLNNPVQRKAYDTHKGYNKPEPQVPTNYHGVWCTGYCKKYFHDIEALDKDKMKDQKMPLKCGHEVCVLCVQFDPHHAIEDIGQAQCPFAINMPDCACSVCPYLLEKHIVGDCQTNCPKCHHYITDLNSIHRELTQHMSFGDYIYYILPSEIRPFATKWHIGLMTTAFLTAKFVHYFGKKSRLYNQFGSLETAADLTVSSLLSLEFDQFDDMNILGLQERFDIATFTDCLKTDEDLKERLTNAITQFDDALKEVYDTICARYYYHPAEVFLQKESALVTRLTACLTNLKEEINQCRITLGIKKTTITPGLKSFAGLCLGGLVGMYIWSKK